MQITFNGKTKKEFTKCIDKALSEYPEDYSEILSFESAFISKFVYYSQFHKIKYGNILFINLSGMGTHVMKNTGDYLTSEYDWILLLLLVLVSIIVLLTFLDYYFHSQRKYDISLKTIFY